MRLLRVFLRRRIWILAHHWLAELALSLLLPVGIYLSIAISLENLIQFGPEGVPFQEWLLPGLVFVVVLVTSYFPTFSDLSENRRLLPFYESVVASPNSAASVLVALIAASIPEVLIRSLVAFFIFQFLSGAGFPILPLLGLVFFLVILSFLIINLAVTLTLATKSPVVHLIGIFTICLFLIFSSGWIIPLGYFPSSLQQIFSALPTTMLLEGGRLLLFHGELTVVTWLVPLIISFVWLILNAVVFARVSAQ